MKPLVSVQDWSVVCPLLSAVREWSPRLTSPTRGAACRRLMMEPLRRTARRATQPEARAPRAHAREFPSAQAVERSWLDRHRVIIYFLVALLAVDLGVATHRDFWNLYSPDDYIERVEGCLHTAPDVVLLRGSTVSEGIDPAALVGLRWRGQPLQRPYNLGLPGATTSEVWHAVEHGLREPPRLVVYGLTASDWNDSRQEPHGPSALMSVSDVATSVAARPDSAEWVIRRLPSRSHRTPLESVLLPQRHSPLGGRHCRQPLAGPVSRRRRTSTRERRACPRTAPRRRFRSAARVPTGSARLRQSRGGVAEAFPFLEKYRITGGHFSYLQRLLDWAEQQHVEVVLVDMPVSADLEADVSRRLCELSTDARRGRTAAPRSGAGRAARRPLA